MITKTKKKFFKYITIIVVILAFLIVLPVGWILEEFGNSNYAKVKDIEQQIKYIGFPIVIVILSIWPLAYRDKEECPNRGKLPGWLRLSFFPMISYIIALVFYINEFDTIVTFFRNLDTTGMIIFGIVAFVVLMVLFVIIFKWVKRYNEDQWEVIKAMLIVLFIWIAAAFVGRFYFKDNSSVSIGMYIINKEMFVIVTLLFYRSSVLSNYPLKSDFESSIAGENTTLNDFKFFAYLELEEEYKQYYKEKAGEFLPISKENREEVNKKNMQYKGIEDVTVAFNDYYRRRAGQYAVFGREINKRREK